MSREKTAYEKMFDDGTAYKPIKIDQPSPDNPGGGKGGGAPDPDRPNVDYSLFDTHMKDMVHEKVEAKKAAVKNPTRPPPRPAPIQQGGIDKILRLEKRIELLEQAIGLVMETQTKLMRG